MHANKPVPVVNLPPVSFIRGPTRQGIKGNINGSWYPEISVAVTTMLGVPVEEALGIIEMNSRNVVIHMNCNGEIS